MGEPTVIAPGGGEVIGDTPDRRVEIVSDVDELHATWSRFGPGRDGADLHIHRHHTDLFYVLAGELTVRLGADEDAVAPAGTLARVPPFVVHGFRNGSDEELRYLNLHVPGCGFADYMRGLRDREPVDFDQDDPPAAGSSSDAAVIGDAAVAREEPGLRVVVHADLDALTVTEVALRSGVAPADTVGADQVVSIYVLEGSLRAGDHVAEAGTWLQQSPGESVTLTADAPARYLEIRTPGG